MLSFPMSPTWRRSLMTSLAVASLAAPVPAMMVAGGAPANEAAKNLGAACAKSVCLLDILSGSKYEFCTGTLVRVDPEAGKGLILTTAHCFVRHGKPVAVAISFAANPVRDRQRIAADGFRCHPDYDGKARTGPDLALVEFTLPKGFAVEPMLLAEEENLDVYQLDDLFPLAGYGSFVRAAAGESKAVEVPAWDASTADGRVRRMGYLPATFKGPEEAAIERPSFEAVHQLLGPEDRVAGASCRPWRFKASEHWKFQLKFQGGDLCTEGVPTVGDSGAPLFRLDSKSMLPRLVAVFTGTAFNVSKTEAISSAAALTPGLLQWLEEKEAKTMHRLEWNDRINKVLQSIYDSTFKADPAGAATPGS
jgi:hypothetical protein